MVDNGGKFAKVGMQFFLNPQILEFNSQSKIPKFLRYVSPKISNPQISLDWAAYRISANVSSPQIANPQIFHHKTERMKHLILFPPFIAKLSGRRFVWPNFLFYKNSN
jgi:hypothetical protein